MNLIIVGRPGATPRVLAFGHGRAKTLAICGLGLVFALIAGFGALIGARFLGPALLTGELEQARGQLQAQREELDRMNQTLTRDLDALALRMGRLQAEATRLNALGERLAKLGKLDDGEFNFREEPAMGGPEAPTAQAEIGKGELEQALAALEHRLAAQARQLDMMEGVLSNRNLDQILMPAGIPVRHGYSSSGFGNRTDPFSGRSEFHTGVDFNGPAGSDVLAVAGGVVAFAGVKDGYGNVVEIDHGNGYVTRYAHNQRNVVEVGRTVRGGDVVAKMGSTGRATGNHVHLEVFLNGRLVNPTEYVRNLRAGA
jgi:murein DD-endopeptidase MepM/ murein hydrolase activator NlpD